MSAASSKKHQWKPGGYKPRPAQTRPRLSLVSGVPVCRACHDDGHDAQGFPCPRCGGSEEEQEQTW